MIDDWPDDVFAIKLKYYRNSSWHFYSFFFSVTSIATLHTFMYMHIIFEMFVECQSHNFEIEPPTYAEKKRRR